MDGFVLRTLQDILRRGGLPESVREDIGRCVEELRAEPTRGPWRLERGQILNEAGEVLASFPHGLGGREDRSNARLVAAAPLLYEALKGLLAAPLQSFPDGAKGYLVNEEAIGRAWEALRVAGPP